MTSRNYACMWVTYKSGIRCYLHLQTRMGVIVIEDLKRLANSPAPDVEHHISRMAQRKLQVLQAAGFACEQCGETECLTIDHVQPLGAQYGHKTGWRNNLEQWDQGTFQVLCAWCHRQKDGWDKIGNTLEAP